MSNDAYLELIAAKSRYNYDAGFDCNAKWSHLFPFQSDLVRWGLRKGRSAFFEGTGLGKTRQQITVGHEVVNHAGTNSRFLLVAPLAVVRQTIAEGQSIGIDVRYVVDNSEVRPGISITNFERVKSLDASMFDGIGLDESSILKNGDGTIRTMLITMFARTPYRFAFTATPAPNDLDELGNHAEFLGVMTLAEMRAMFFTHGGENGETQKWILKGHAKQAFWRWVCRWAAVVRMPSDLGYPDDGYVLPNLTYVEHVIPATHEHARAQGKLYAEHAKGLKEQRAAKKATIDDRVALVARIANSSSDRCVVWCHLNAESTAATKLINGAVEITGAQKAEEKAEKIQAFSDCKIDRVVVKPDIAGMGVNWQKSHVQIWLGVSNSFEEFFQAVRRQWRFGQDEPVTVHVISSELEGGVVANIKRKQAEFDAMTAEMSAMTMQYVRANVRSTSQDVVVYNPTRPMMLPSWIVSQP
jgi:hypothetical protein